MGVTEPARKQPDEKENHALLFVGLFADRDCGCHIWLRRHRSGLGRRGEDSILRLRCAFPRLADHSHVAAGLNLARCGIA